MANLEATLAAAAKTGPSTMSRKYDPDSLHWVALDLLDDNPWQPRSSMDDGALGELVASIRAQGLIQTIAVKPTAAGRFIIVAGHRRVTAFRRLLAEAKTDSEKLRWSTIGAQMKVAIDDAQLAAQAYMENVNREALTPLDEARALEGMVEKGLASTNEELANLLQQKVARVKRLRRIFTAPTAVKDAVSSGLMVGIGSDPEGKERKELRRLDLHAALSFVRMHEHLRKTQPRKADERTERAVRRALASNWSLRHCDDYVDGILAGREEHPELTKGDAEPIFSQSVKRFAVDVSRLKNATESQRQALRSAFEALLKVESGPASAEGQH